MENGKCHPTAQIRLKLDLNNYRPVSILFLVAKITERIIFEQLMTYLIEHNILCSEQHGVRPGHSTESAMLDVVGHIVINMDSGLISCITTQQTPPRLSIQ